MIPLQIAADPLPIVEPLVLRLRTSSNTELGEASLQDAHLMSQGNDSAEFDVSGFSLRVHTSDAESLDGDVVLAIPGRRSLHRLMQLENIGFARMNWDREFYDNSVSFKPIAQGIDLATARGMRTSLYNFPLCTVPPIYRNHCVASISDWKQKFLAVCGECALSSNCGGFFEWYPDKKGFAEIQAQ